VRPLSGEDCDESVFIGQTVGHDGQQRPEVNVFLEWEAQWQVQGDVIEVTAPFSFTGEVPGGDQFGHDSLSSAFGDVQSRSDVTQTNTRIAGNQEQRIAVIREQSKSGQLG
jgi:hypothetical protein